MRLKENEKKKGKEMSKEAPINRLRRLGSR